jgi:hypothetical protein
MSLLDEMLNDLLYTRGLPSERKDMTRKNTVGHWPEVFGKGERIHYYVRAKGPSTLEKHIKLKEL